MDIPTCTYFEASKDIITKLTSSSYLKNQILKSWVGAATLPPSFLPSGTQAFYFINRQNDGLLWTRL